MNALNKQQTVAERLSSFIRYCLAVDRVPSCASTKAGLFR